MEKYDIYYYYVPFQEDKSKGKRRPILILDNDIAMPIASITSNLTENEYIYIINDWKQAGLDHISAIRFDKVILIGRGTVNKNDYIGHLSEEDIQKIKSLKLHDNLSTEKDIFTKDDLEEDTVKQGNYWVNKGEDGTHGKFKTKKAADKQRKAMFANGFRG